MKILNTKALKAEIIKAGMTQEKLAQEIGITSTSLSNKMRGVTQFTLPEVKKIVKALSITEIDNIFFTD